MGINLPSPWIAALLGLTAWSAAATECGIRQTGLMAPFAGHWRDEDGQLFDIAPGKVDHTYIVHLGTGDETNHSSPRFVARYDGEKDDEADLDCRAMTATERDEIAEDMEKLADFENNRQQIPPFRTSLTQPPYPMMAIRGYEYLQWLILLDHDRLLDVQYGEALYSVTLYRRDGAK